MASIQENLKNYPAASTDNMFEMFDLIESRQLLTFDKWFLEATLFIEMFVLFSGSTFDQESEASKEQFLSLITSLNKTLAMTDNEELRKAQRETLLEIYKRHFIALNSNKELLKAYCLIAYINRIDHSLKIPYIEALFNIKMSVIHNLKFKEGPFKNTLEFFTNFWENSLEAQSFFNGENLQVEYEVVKTIIKLQDARGYNYE